MEANVKPEIIVSIVLFLNLLALHPIDEHWGVVVEPVWDINHLEAELLVSSCYRESNSGRFRCIRNSQLSEK